MMAKADSRNDKLAKAIEDLIQKGQTFNFKNNSYNSSHGTFSQPSSDFLSWITTVEDFISTNFGIDSAAFKTFKTSDRRKLDGYYEDEFDKQLSIFIGALKSCKNITPKSKKSDEHQIISLIKNPSFWTVLTIMIAASFSLGIYFGSAKFDKEKNEYYEQVKEKSDEIEKLQQSIDMKDSTILILNNGIIHLKDSLTDTRTEMNNLYLLLGSKLK